MQARDKRDLNDTSRMIKEILRDLENKNSELKFNQDLASTSRDIEGSHGILEGCRE